MVLYQYQGAVFDITETVVWRNGNRVTVCNVVGIQCADVEDLYLPLDYNGNTFHERYILEKEKQHCVFERVKRLHIPENVESISAKNDIFPALEKIIVDPKNRYLKGIGPMLVREGTLKYVFSAGQKEQCHIPDGIDAISKNAFGDTQCTEIISEKVDIQIEDDIFNKHSRILDTGKEIIIGNTYVLCAKETEGEIIVPEHVTSIVDDAFSRAPRRRMKLTLPTLFDKNKFSQIESHVRRLRLTKCTGKLDFDALRTFSKLESVEFPENSLYQIIDGCIYSKDGKTIYYCPPCLTNIIDIRPGTEQIGVFAFQNNKKLKAVTIPDSVSRIESGAFFHCQALESINLPSKLESLPGATDVMPFGVFENCTSLKEIELPCSLRCIGSFAFSNTGLRNIKLPEGVEYIGEYAFASYDAYGRPALVSSRLPSTLISIGRGAIAGSFVVTAYEGTASGLMSAIKADWPDRAASLLYYGKQRKQSTVFIYKKNGYCWSYEIYIPESFDTSVHCLLEQAWNQARFDMDLYAVCFEKTSDPKEKQEIAILMAGKYNQIADKTPYFAYLRQNCGRICSELLARKDEDGLIKLIKTVDFSAEQLREMITIASHANHTTVVAYLLQAIEPKAKNEINRLQL